MLTAAPALLLQPKDEIAWKDEAFDIPVPESSGGCTLCILIYTQDHISDDQASTKHLQRTIPEPHGSPLLSAMSLPASPSLP